MRPRVGDTIGGRYLLLEPIAEGGFSWVFKARHVDVDQLMVAVKVLKPDASPDMEVVKRFKREAAATAALRNRHTARLMDFGETPDGSAYLVMEFIDGVPLNALLARHHEDYALWRRYLVDDGWMTRERGIYRLTPRVRNLTIGPN